MLEIEAFVGVGVRKRTCRTFPADVTTVGAARKGVGTAVVGKTYIDGWETRLPEWKEDAVTKEAAIEEVIEFGTSDEVADVCSSSKALVAEELTTKL